MTSATTRSPILWGAYLACSWTWCIGMFLPALLLRDMGWSGFWIFAIPNVIGAAAMGWTLTSRTRSTDFVEKHAQAVWWFSAVTLAFHFFWILWLSSFIQEAFNIPLHFLAGSIGIVCIFVLVTSRAVRRGKTPQTAIGLLVFSVAILIGSLCSTDLQAVSASLLDSAPSSMNFIWMLPVMLFGFLLCPYLDITFHHARQQLDSKKNGRIGFSVGFVGFFFFMIFLTTRYAGLIASALDSMQVTPAITLWLAAGILIHMLCQWVFTVQVHFDRIRTLPGAKSKQPMLLAFILVSGIIGFLASWLPSYSGLLGGEIIYRLFMAAYGLIFPAYILYRVIARNSWKPSIWIAVTVASPFFWMGFIERQPIWLIPGMAIILCGTLIQQKKR